MRIAVLFSGGKDSTLTAYRAIKEGHQVNILISMDTDNAESYMFHRPNIELTGLQAQAMRIPLVRFRTAGVKEGELDDLMKAIGSVKGMVDAIGAGALASRYQYERVRKLCELSGLKTYTPLWGIDPAKEWEELLKNGFEICIAAVACGGLGKEWLGRTVDVKAFEELKALSERHRFHLGFEGGEAETFVTYCPMFSGRIRILSGKSIWDPKTGSGTFQITKAELESR